MAGSGNDSVWKESSAHCVMGEKEGRTVQCGKARGCPALRQVQGAPGWSTEAADLQSQRVGSVSRVVGGGWEIESRQGHRLDAAQFTVVSFALRVHVNNGMLVGRWRVLIRG